MQRVIANDIGISDERVLYILHGELHMKNLFGKLVPHTLTIQQKLDAKGILLIYYLQKGKTINSEYYCSLLDQLDEKIREKRSGLQHKNIKF